MPNRALAAMHHGDARTGSRFGEQYFDFGFFVVCKIAVAPFEQQCFSADPTF